MRLSSNAYIVLIIVAGFVLIGYLFVVSPDSAEKQLPLILAGIAGLVAVIAKQGDTDNKVADVKTVAAEAKTAAKIAVVESVKSKDASRKNADAISVVSDTVDTVHGIVNHQKDLLEAELAESRRTAEALTREVAGLHAALVAAQQAPGSRVAQALAHAIPIHNPDTPTPAADAVQAAEAQATTPSRRTPTGTRVVLPPDEPTPGPGDHQ